MNRKRWLSFGVATLLVTAPRPALAKPGVINYSPWHLPGQDPGSPRTAPTDAQIAADLLLLWKYTDEIRTYAVDAAGDSVIRACQGQGMLVNVGSFLVREQMGTDPARQGQALDVAQNQAINAQVIDSLVAIANRGYDVVQSLIVGNELVLWDNMTIPRLHEYIAAVRQRTGGRYPITTGETWNVGFEAHPELAEGLDFVLFHGHPYWEGAGIDVAISKSNAHAWDVMRALFPGRRLVQGETGWPTTGGAFENATYDYAGVAVPSVENQARFIQDLKGEIRGSVEQGLAMEVWLFEAFDEPWKGAEGTVGASWGFLDSAGVPKHDAIAARLVPLSATEAPPGTVTIVLDGAATGAAAAVVADPASWQISGGTITGASLGADGRTLTITYAGGDAFKGLRAAATACDVIARRRFVFGDPSAHPVPGRAPTTTPDDGGGSVGGDGRDRGDGGAPVDVAGAGCACAIGRPPAQERRAGAVAALALAATLARRRRRRTRAALLAALSLGACSLAPRRERGGADGGADGGAADATTAPEAPPPEGTSGPPDFGPNVLVFDPTMPMDAIQGRVDAVFNQQSDSQFGAGRYALLFKPGVYDLNVRVGYYTEVLGLGSSPEDVAIDGTVRSSGNASGNATLSFWRACGNLTVTPPAGQLDMWAVSQGTALRRVHVRGALALADSGNSSGGFLADTRIDAQVASGSQQQWLSRNAEWASWNGGVWNMVFVGTAAPPSGAWPAAPYTVVDRTPVVREKPFLFVDAAGSYAVRVPPLRRDATGVSWSDAAASPGLAIPLGQFYVAHAGQDSAATINAALDQGRNLLLTPGIYHLESRITVSRAHTIVLGLGMATLVADGATGALAIADVDDVTIGGIIIDAGPTGASTLLLVGDPGASQDHAQAPTLLHDVFCRVGGGSAGTAASCVTINSNNVVGDNLWMWRADHGAGAGWTQNRSANGLIVNGADVTIHGLFVEHFQEYQTLWNGDRGRVFFYQSEMPYDPPDQPSWQHGGVNGYAAYKVADTVTTHEAFGLGVYCAFRAPVSADTAFEAPATAGVALHHLVTVWLSGAAGSSIAHILDATGAAATQTNRRATAD